MSDNIIEITENTNYSITIDTSLIQNDNNIVIELTNPNNIDVINNTTVLVSDLPQGYPLDWTVGNLPISRLSGLIGTSGINYSSGIISLSGIPTNLLPVQNLLAGSGIDIANNQGIFTVAVTGQFGLTGEQVDDRVSSLLVSGNYTTLNYDDENNKLTISVTGLQPSGNYSLAGHSHVIADVSGLQIILDNKQPSGIYASGVHTHNASDITNFSSAVSGLLPTISGSGYVTSNFSNNSYIIGVSGLQPSGNYSTVGHTHTSSNITDFNSSVSGLLPAINNSGDNRLLTSTGSSFGIDAESNLTFDGNNTTPTLSISGLIPTLELRGAGSVIFLNENLGNIIDSTGGDVTIIGSSGLTISGGINNLNINNSGLDYNNIPVSISGHSHNSSNITDFNISVSGLLTRHALLNSPNFSGVPTVPTAISGTNSTQAASTAFVRNEISSLVNSAPSTLDTLNELASALGNDPNFATTIASGLGQKANLVHNHIASNISDFNSSVSGLLPVKNILGGTNVSITTNSGIYTVAVTGQLGLSSEQVDDRVNDLLKAGSYISLSYDDNNNSLTISSTGLQPSGDYSLVGHTHISANITDFNSATSGLINSSLSTSISGGAGIDVSYYSNTDTLLISTSGVSLLGHQHTYSEITDFNTGVRLNRINDLTIPSGNVSFNNYLLTNLATPTSGTDAVNKNYIDTLYASTSGLGIASFSSNDFSVVSGAVTIKHSGVDNNQLAFSYITLGSSTINLGSSITNVQGLILDGGTP
jgi:hypothetical protein